MSCHNTPRARRWACVLATVTAITAVTATSLPLPAQAQAAAANAVPAVQFTPEQLADRLSQLMDGLQTVGSQITKVDTGIGCGCVGPHIGPNFKIEARRYARADVQRALKALELMLRNGNAGKATEVAKTKIGP